MTEPREGSARQQALSLVAKGYLTAGEDGQTFTITQKAKEFLAYDPKPEFEEVGAATSEEPAE